MSSKSTQKVSTQLNSLKHEVLVAAGNRNEGESLPPACKARPATLTRRQATADIWALKSQLVCSNTCCLSQHGAYLNAAVGGRLQSIRRALLLLFSILLVQTCIALFVVWSSAPVNQSGVLNLSSIPASLSTIHMALDVKCRASCYWGRNELPCFELCNRKPIPQMQKAGFGTSLYISLVAECASLASLLLLLKLWRRQVAAAGLRRFRNRPSISDFSVVIPNIPNSIQRSHVIRHFSSLYSAQSASEPRGFIARHILSRFRQLPEPQIRRELAMPENRKCPPKSVTRSDLEGTVIAAVHIHRTSPELLETSAKLVDTIGKHDDLYNGIIEQKHQRDRDGVQWSCCARALQRWRYGASLSKASQAIQQVATQKHTLDSERCTAFVTFRDKEIRDLVVDEYSSGRCWGCGMPARLKLLQGSASHELKVEQAPPPSEVLWTHINRRFRKRDRVWSCLWPLTVLLGGWMLAVAGTFGAGGFSQLRLLGEISPRTCMYDIPMQELSQSLVKNATDIVYMNFQGTLADCDSGRRAIAVLNSRLISQSRLKSALSGTSQVKIAQEMVEQRFSSFASIPSDTDCGASPKRLTWVEAIPETNTSRSIRGGIVLLACLEIQQSSTNGLFHTYRAKELAAAASSYDSMVFLVSAATGCAAFLASQLTTRHMSINAVSLEGHTIFATLLTLTSNILILVIWPAIYALHLGSSAADATKNTSVVLGHGVNFSGDFFAGFLPHHTLSTAIYCLLVPLPDLLRGCAFQCVFVPCGGLWEGRQQRWRFWRRPGLNTATWYSQIVLIICLHSTVAAAMHAYSFVLCLLVLYTLGCFLAALLLCANTEAESRSQLWDFGQKLTIRCFFVRVALTFLIFTAPEVRPLLLGEALFGWPDKIAAEMRAQLPSGTPGSILHETISRLQCSAFGGLIFMLCTLLLLQLLRKVWHVLGLVLRTYTAQAWSKTLLQLTCRPCCRQSVLNIGSSFIPGEFAHMLMMQSAAQTSLPQLFAPFFVPPAKYSRQALTDFAAPLALRESNRGCCAKTTSLDLQLAWQLSPAPVLLGEGVPLRRQMWTQAQLDGTKHEAETQVIRVGHFMTTFDVISALGDSGYKLSDCWEFGSIATAAAHLHAAASSMKHVDMLELRRSLNGIEHSKMQRLRASRICLRLLAEGSLPSDMSGLADCNPDAKSNFSLGCFSGQKTPTVTAGRSLIKLDKQVVETSEYTDVVNLDGKLSSIAPAARARVNWDQVEEPTVKEPSKLVHVTGADRVLSVAHHTGWEAPTGLEPRPFTETWHKAERAFSEAKWEATKDRMRAGLKAKPSPRLIPSESKEIDRHAHEKNNASPAATAEPIAHAVQIDVRPSTSHSVGASGRRLLTADRVTVVGSSRASAPFQASRPGTTDSIRPKTSEVVQKLHENRELWVKKGIEKGAASEELARLGSQIKEELHGKTSIVPHALLAENGNIDWAATAQNAKLRADLKKAAGHGQLSIQPGSSSDRISAGGQELLLSGGASQAHVDVQETNTGDMKVLRVESSIKVYQSSMQDAVRLEHEIQRRMKLATSGRKSAWRQDAILAQGVNQHTASPSNLERAAGASYSTLRRHSKKIHDKYSNQAFDNYISLD